MGLITRRRGIAGFGGAPAPPPPTSFLSTYSGALFAYSLRQLGASEVDVVRIRRTSDNAEEDFNPTEIGDGTLTTWTGANDGAVVKWYDQSGNNNDGVQSTASAQPLLVDAGTVTTDGNGNYAIFFGDGFGGYAFDTGIDAYTYRNSQGVEFGLSVVASNQGAFDIIFNFPEANAGDIGIALFLNATTTVELWNDGSKLIDNTASMVLDELTHVQVAFWDNASTYTRSIYYDGSQTNSVFNTAFEPTNSYNVAIGAKNIDGTGTSDADSYIAEVIMWSSKNITGDFAGVATNTEAAYTLTI